MADDNRPSGATDPGSAYSRFQKQPETEDQSFGSLYTTAAGLDHIGPALLQEFGSGKTNPVDPGYTVSKDDFAEATKGIPSDRWDEFEDVRSREDLFATRDRVKKTLDAERKLASAGWEGTAARLVANFTDPTAWAATAATEGLLAPVVAAAKLGRAGRILYSGAVGAGENAALEGYLASQSSSHDIHDVLTATAFGAVLGGGVGAVMPGASRAEGREAFDTLAANTGTRAQQAQADAAASRVPKATELDTEYGKGLRHRFDNELPEEIRQADDDIERLTDATGVARSIEQGAESKLADARNADPLDTLVRRRGDETGEGVASRVTYRQSGDVGDVGHALKKAVNASRGGSGQTQAVPDNFRRVVEEDHPQGVSDKAWSLYRTLLPERKNGMGLKDARKTKNRIDKDVRNAETDQAYAIRQAEADLEDARTSRAETEADLAEAKNRRADLDEESARLVSEMENLKARPMAQAPADTPAEATEASDLPPVETEVEPTAVANDSANAARVEDSAVNESLTREDIDLPQQLVEKSEDAGYASKARGSIYGRMSASQSTWARAINRLMHTDGTAGDAARGQSTEFAAAEMADKINQYHGVKMMRAYQPAFREWAKEQDIGWLYRGQEKHRQRYAREVSHYMRTGEATSEPVRKAGEAMREQFDALLAEAKRLRIEGFVDVENLGNYFPRMWEADQFVRWADDGRVGSEGLVRLVRQAVRNGSEDMPDDIVDSIASAVVTRFRRKGAGMDADFHRTLTGTDIDAVLKELGDAGLPRERLSQIEDYLANKQRSSEGGVHQRAKRRIVMDESASIDVPGHGPLRITDLMQSDAEQVGMQYIRSVGGQIAMARKLKEYDLSDHPDGLINPERILDKMTEKAREEGIEEANVERLKVSRNMIAGRPPTEGMTSNAAQAMRIAKQLNFVRLMGQVGFAQVAELGPIVGQTGMSTVLSQVPRMRGLLTRAKNGELNDELAGELEEMGAVFGVERMLFQPRLREEDFGATATTTTRTGRALNGAELTLSKVSRAVSDFSGMSAVTIATQRMASTAMAQKFLKLALKPTKINRKHMLSIGLDDEMLDRVLGQVRDHHVSESGLLVRRKLKRLNLEQWDDLEARDALLNSFHKWGNRMVQRNMIGELPAFMHKEWGQLLTQFRSFVGGAYEKHTLHGVSQRNRMVFATMAWSSFFAGLSYTAQTYLNSKGRSDQKQYLEQRLNAVELGKASFQRAGYASLLPGLIDTAATLPGFVDKPIFAYGRTTGLATSFLDGNPTVDLVNSTGKAVSGILAAGNPAREDYDYSRGDFESLWSLMAFNNAIIMRNLGNSIADNLPEKSVQQPREISDYF